MALVILDVQLLSCAVNGNAGYIKLWLPVFHIGYFKSTITTLQCICKTCSSILLTEEDYRKFLRQFRSVCSPLRAPTFPVERHVDISLSATLLECISMHDT